MNLRPAFTSDARALAALVTELGYETTPEAMAARLARIDAHPDYGAVVADDAGKVLGLIGLQRALAFEYDTPYTRIAALIVAPGDRRGGVGARLVGHAETWARSRGCTLVVVASGLQRAGAHRFYESLGYETEGFSFVKALDAT